MPLIPVSAPGMQSVYRQTAQDIAPATDAVVSSKDLLQAVWWLSRRWVERMAVTDPQRVKLIQLGMLTDDLVRAGDYSPAAMTTVRTLLCASCRRLNAAHEKCTGQSLDRCSLLSAKEH